MSSSSTTEHLADLQLFGIRHHGPGCARSLRAALERYEPDILLIEGPPDAQQVLDLAQHPAMSPPVALLIYAQDRPEEAIFYPFTVFSPEWQALLYGYSQKIAIRFIDLPSAVHFGLQRAEQEQPEQPQGKVANGSDAESAAGTMHDDPVGLLSEAAGYSDRELWWEHQIEQRQDALGLFEGILEAISAVRATAPAPTDREQLREAQMRQGVRAAQKEGFKRIAVVCGAWHTPALTVDALGSSREARADAALLQKLPKIKVQATWIPWNNSRLSYRSGYGAGVRSPGWYEHLWTEPDRATIRWAARIAALLREQDFEASSGHVIETVRLAEALAALRDLPLPGLDELHEAAQTVFCMGDPLRMTLIRERLEIGDRMGSVPDETPLVPLQSDLMALQRRLRLKVSTEILTLDLDLRQENDRARSHLLHRLSLLNIAWGQLLPQSGNQRGTFHEYWQLKWEPELTLRVIEANLWGNTVEAAATSRLSRLTEAASLPQLSTLLDRALLAALPLAIDTLLAAVGAQAARTADIRLLMGALLPLARIARYGDVRGRSAAEMSPVITALFERIVVGLPGACLSLNDEAAQELAGRPGEQETEGSIANVQSSLSLLNDSEKRQEWQQLLRHLTGHDGVHGLVRGWCCRLLLESNQLSQEELQRYVRLSLARAVAPAQAAAWLEGILRGGGLLLLHQQELWQVLDIWLTELHDELFIELLPLIRRAFADFRPAERRQMGEIVSRLSIAQTAGTSTAGDTTGVQPEIDHARAALVLPILAHILGVSEQEVSNGHS